MDSSPAKQFTDLGFFPVLFLGSGRPRFCCEELSAPLSGHMIHYPAIDEWDFWVIDLYHVRKEILPFFRTI